MCLKYYESYVDDEGRPMPTREGRAAYAREQQLRRASVPSHVPLIIPPRHSTPPLQSYEPKVYKPIEVVETCREVGSPVDNEKLAAAIADAIVVPPKRTTTQPSMPLHVEIHMDERHGNGRRSREYEAAERRYIEREAERRVAETNRRAAEIRAIEDAARHRVENEFHQSFSSFESESGSSREHLLPSAEHRRHHHHRALPRRVTWGREREQALVRANDIEHHQCSNCHHFGHRSRDCPTQVTRVVNVNHTTRDHGHSYQPHSRHQRPRVRYIDPEFYA